MTLRWGSEPTQIRSETLKVSSYRYRRMEMGQHDFTLQELQELADALGETLLELLSDFPNFKALHG